MTLKLATYQPNYRVNGYSLSYWQRSGVGPLIQIKWRFTWWGGVKINGVTREGEHCKLDDEEIRAFKHYIIHERPVSEPQEL